MSYEKLIFVSAITILALLILVWFFKKLLHWFDSVDIMPDDYDEPFTIDEIKSLSTNKN
ncbi:MAG: hypothetical protein WC223_11450 [Bacteroidales bacterium]|jgi:hypothetical protein